jgi:hypothetical protein
LNYSQKLKRIYLAIQLIKKIMRQQKSQTVNFVRGDIKLKACSFHRLRVPKYIKVHEQLRLYQQILKHDSEILFIQHVNGKVLARPQESKIPLEF